MTVGITELPPEGMQLGGVALAGDAERGTKTTEGLSLLFTTAGITVQGPQPQIERLLVWSGLDSATCREKIALPDGRNAAVMELTSGGQAIRFLLPLDTVTPGQAAYLDQALPAWLARYKGPASATNAPPVDAPTGETAAAGITSSSAPSSTTPPPPPPPAGPAAAATTAAAAGAAAPDGVAGAGAASNGSAHGPSGSDGPPPSFDQPLGRGTLPPPPTAPATAASATTASAAPPPPPPPPPPPVEPVSAAADLSGTPPPPVAAREGAVSGDPAAGVAEAPVKKTRNWRKGRKPESTPPRSEPIPPPGDLGLSGPPSDPPLDPVSLKGSTLPPPPREWTSVAAAGAVARKPPIDPATGEVVWPATPPADKPPAKGRSWRKGAKSGAVAAAGAASAAAMADRASSDAAPAPAPWAPAASPAPPGLDLGTSPFAGDPPPTVTPPGSLVAAFGGRPPKAKRSNRSTVGVLVVVLVIVLAAIGYFAYKKSNDNSTTTTAATVPPPSPAAAATVLAASINLRISDLPPGWSRAPGAGQPARPPVAPAAIQARANQALAGCLGQSGQAVAGLFAGATLPGQVGAAKSPTFQTGADPDVTMYSTSAVVVSTAAVQALAVPFTNASFTTCYGQYQTSLAAAVVPGATAQVQPVTLDAPAGVKAYGYLTTLTLPNQGSEVVGQAFLLGGRIVTLLEPSTNGPSIPSAPFTSAFNAIAGRMAASVDK